MKTSALPFALFVFSFAVGAIATSSLSSALAATAAVIPIEQQRLIVKDSGTAVLGAANPDVTVVEYFDYNCPYCRKLAPSIHALVNNDRKAAVVFKEWPIFGGISVYAARSALASQWQRT
jgi:protein-disulfide isomerase